MQIAVERYNLLKKDLLEVITKEGTDWSKIVEYIKSKDRKVKNWLVVIFIF